MVAAFASSDFSRDEESWNEAVQMDRGPDDLSIPQPDEDGNYCTPVLERILQAVAEFDSGILKEDEIIALLGKAEEAISNMLALTLTSQEQGLADPDNPICQATQVGFEEHVEAIAKLKHYFETKESKLRKEGLVLLQRATNRLVKSYADFQRLRVASLVVLCPSCGAENRKGTAKCESCRTLLPTQPPTEKDNRLLAVAAEGVIQAESLVPIKTPNYERIERCIHAWEARELDDQGLAAEIAAVERNMEAHHEANAAERDDLAELTEEEQQLMSALLDSIDAALEANLKALARMQQYFSDSDPEHLRVGFEKFAAATRQTVDAYMASQALINAGPDDT